MRGAQPDAECPRCHHRQPPAGALVTCLTCGLSYPPKELQHRSSKPSRSPPDALVVAQPVDLQIDTNGHALTYRWTDRGLAGMITIGASTTMAMVVWLSMLPVIDKLGYTGFLVALLVYGVSQSRRRPRLSLDHSRILSASGTLLLADIARIDVDSGRVTAVTRYGKSHEIVVAKDPEIAVYIGGEIARRIGQAD